MGPLLRFGCQGFQSAGLDFILNNRLSESPTWDAVAGPKKMGMACGWRQGASRTNAIKLTS